jgi:hypothetical protein
MEAKFGTVELVACSEVVVEDKASRIGSAEGGQIFLNSEAFLELIESPAQCRIDSGLGWNWSARKVRESAIATAAEQASKSDSRTV